MFDLMVEMPGLRDSSHLHGSATQCFALLPGRHQSSWPVFLKPMITVDATDGLISCGPPKLPGPWRGLLSSSSYVHLPHQNSYIKRGLTGGASIITNVNMMVPHSEYSYSIIYLKCTSK